MDRVLLTGATGFLGYHVAKKLNAAGIRPRGKHASSVEVFSVIRSERTIRRADMCVLVIDATSGVTAQDKKIAALMQKAHKPSLVVVNKWDLVKPARHASEMYSNNLASLLEHFWDKEAKTLRLDLTDEILKHCVLTHDGRIVNEAIDKLYHPNEHN